MHEEPLVDAAGRIADGHPLDWPSITSTLSTDSDREIADELALLARIAVGHRALHELLPQPHPARSIAPGTRGSSGWSR